MKFIIIKRGSYNKQNEPGCCKTIEGMFWAEKPKPAPAPPDTTSAPADTTKGAG